MVVDDDHLSVALADVLDIVPEPHGCVGDIFRTTLELGRVPLSVATSHLVAENSNRGSQSGRIVAAPSNIPKASDQPVLLRNLPTPQVVIVTSA